MEELEFIIEACEESMTNAVKHLERELLNIRAGKANPTMLSSVKLDYYGSTTPLSQVANINTPDAQTLSVQPWEKDKLPPPITTATSSPSSVTVLISLAY